MSDQPPTGPPPSQPERQPLFDPYTGERLQPEGEASRGAPTGDATTQPFTAPTSTPRRRTSAIPILAVVAVLAVIGGTIWYVTGPRADAQAEKKAHAAAAAAKRVEAQRKDACEKLLTDTYRSLRSLNSRLDVGMIEADYTKAVGDAQADYDQIDTDQVGKNKCASYGDLGRALAKYAQASTYWNDCIVQDYCTPDETKLQNYWGDAGVTMDTVKINGLGAKKVVPGEKS